MAQQEYTLDNLSYSVLEFFQDVINFFNGVSKPLTAQQIKAVIGGKEYPNLFATPDFNGWCLLVGRHKIMIPYDKLNRERDFTVALLYVLNHTNNYEQIPEDLLRASIIEIRPNNLVAVEIMEELLNEIQKKQGRQGDKPLS